MVVEILYQGNYAQGKAHERCLENLVYTNKSPKFGGRSDVLAASEVSIFANTCYRWNLKMLYKTCKTCLYVTIERTCFLLLI